MRTRSLHRHSLESLEPRLLLSAAVNVASSLRSSLFVENAGQWADDAVRFALHGDGASIALTQAGAQVELRRVGVDESLETHSFSLDFLNAEGAELTGITPSDATFNYALGDKSLHRNNVSAFEAVRYNELYAGIDLLTWAQADHLKYEFHVMPGANHAQIAIQYEGIEGLTLTADGMLLINLGHDWAALTDDAPLVYQEIDGQRVTVAAAFELLDARTFAFRIEGPFDATRELIIDPTLSWSSYQGTANYDGHFGVVTDEAGNAWVTGYSGGSGATFWATFGPEGANSDIIVSKISSSGTLLSATFLGGTGIDMTPRKMVPAMPLS